MACRGIHFAITDEDFNHLLKARSDKEVVEIIREEIEERWDEEWLFQTDKAWDAIHRCLTDGRLDFSNGQYPLNLCILGGRQLHQGDDYIVALVGPDQAADVAEALKGMNRESLRERYRVIDADDYGCPLSEEDFEYTWDHFEGLVEFFEKAAGDKRHVVFTVDQ